MVGIVLTATRREDPMRAVVIIEDQRLPKKLPRRSGIKALRRGNNRSSGSILF